MKPPLMSPYGLIQESLWPDEWLVLVSCVLLNCTRRKQVEQVFDVFTHLLPDPKSLLECDPEMLRDQIMTLGFMQRRASTLKKLAAAYMTWDHVDPSTLPGIGEYGTRAWKIFMKDDLGDDEPKDGALKLYWRWRKHINVLDG